MIILQCNVTVIPAETPFIWRLLPILSPLVLFASGYLLNDLIQKRKDKKHKKQMLIIIVEWLWVIKEHVKINRDLIKSFIDHLIKSEPIGIAYQYISLDRFLSLPDKDLKLILEDEYVPIMSDTHTLDYSQKEFLRLYDDFQSKVKNLIDRKNEQNKIVKEAIRKFIAHRFIDSNDVMKELNNVYRKFDNNEFYSYNYYIKEFIEPVLNILYQNMSETNIKKNEQVLEFIKATDDYKNISAKDDLFYARYELEFMHLFTKYEFIIPVIETVLKKKRIKEPEQK